MKETANFRKFVSVTEHFIFMIAEASTRSDIQHDLSEVIRDLDLYLKTVDDQVFNKRVNGKWSIAQQIDHLTISNFVTALALTTPKPLLKQVFQTTDRPALNYDEVVWRYQRSLSNGARASLPFQPRLSLLPLRNIVLQLWANSCHALETAIGRCTEEELDACLVPHPILGKITLRELLFFTIYHIRHHLRTIKQIH